MLSFAEVDLLVDATTTADEVDGWSLEKYLPNISRNTARLKNVVNLAYVFPNIIVWRYPLLVDTFLSPDNKVTVVNIAHKYMCLLF